MKIPATGAGNTKDETAARPVFAHQTAPATQSEPA